MKKQLTIALLSVTVATAQDLGDIASPTPEPTIIKASNASDLTNFIFQALPLSPIKEILLPKDCQIGFTNESSETTMEDIIVSYIDKASREVLFCTTAITSPKIAAALVAAKARGATVSGIMTESPNGIRNYNAPSYFMINNVPIFFDPTKEENQNNYLVLDREGVLVTASDWSVSALSGSNSYFAIKDPGIAIAYYNGWVNQLSTTIVPALTNSVLRTIMKNKVNKP